MHIQNDEPVTTDSLGRERFANALSKVIETCETPLVIGLYGTWGVGKTSLMKQIEKRFEDHAKIRTIWFDPWQHQFDEDPAVALLHSMVTQLELGSDGKKLLTVIAAALGNAFLKTITQLSADDIQKFGERYEEERFQIRDKRVRLKTYFSDLVRHASKDGENRLVFLIDDLDRCVPEQVLKVLESLKLYLSLPNCVFLMGVDRAALETSIRQRYKDSEIREADYLDKIVQLPFTIPPIAAKSMAEFVKQQLDEPLGGVVDVLVAGLGDNPRQVKRFINTLILNNQLAAEIFSAKQEPRLLAAVLLLQYRQPELFKRAVLDPKVLVQLSQGGDSAKEFEAQLKSDPRLASVLKALKIEDPASVEPYIYLSEVVGLRQLTFDVVMSNRGPKMIEVIKTIREHTQLGLKDAKDLVDASPPVVVGTGMERDRADVFAAALRSAGAQATIR